MKLDEMAESLTGYEEIGVSTHFGADLSTLLQDKPTMGIRALIFTELARGEMTAAQAKAQAMEMRLKEVTSHYDAEDDEIDPDDPDTESGKDAAPSV